MTSALLSLLILAAPALALGDSESGAADCVQAKRVVEVVISSNSAEDPAAPVPFGPAKRNFRAKLGLLRRIASDPEVAGVRLELKGFPGWAHAIDLMEELHAIRQAGKPIICYAEMLTQTHMMFATLADHLVIPPSAIIGLEGLTAELMYLRDALAKLDVSFEVLHVGDFKTAYEDLARGEMSASQRTMLGQILGEYYEQMVGTIAANRGLGRDAVEALFKDILVEPEVALAAGLVDAVAYEDQFEEQLVELFGGEVMFVDDYGDEGKIDPDDIDNPFVAFAMVMEALSPPKVEAPDEPHVAVVYATGAINSGKSRADFQGKVSTMGSDTIVEALDKCYEDDDVKAVVLRVNSPGGSALASDMIWRAIERVRTRKPVISSMGHVAASGGYWISMGCDAIIAQPSTLTGSIGVVSMLPDVHEALENLGVNVEVVARGPHGEQLALTKHGPTPIIREVITRSMEHTYRGFISKVSAGRRMEPADVEALAGGRVWTGRQAYENGLVDDLGGLDDAIALACVMGGGLAPGSTPVMEYPLAPNLFEQLEEDMADMASFDLGSGARLLLEQLGAGHLGLLLDSMLETDQLLGPDRVQAVMPYHIRVR